MWRKKYLGIISSNVISGTENDTASDIARLMKKNDIGIVVIKREEEVVGLVSERDIARRIVAEGLPPKTTCAKKFMTTEILTVELKDGLNKIYQTLYEMKFKHLLVMDQGKLVGITARRDLLDALTAKKRKV